MQPVCKQSNDFDLNAFQSSLARSSPAVASNAVFHTQSYANLEGVIITGYAQRPAMKACWKSTRQRCPPAQAVDSFSSKIACRAETS
jgi:hypothetical protein